MTPADAMRLSKREREIMDIVYRLGEASARDVASQIADEPGYDSVRVLLSILEKKGHVRHRKDGRTKIYLPTVARARAGRAAARNLVQTFFSGSASRAAVAMLDMSSEKLTSEDLERIAAWLEAERRKQ